MGVVILTLLLLSLGAGTALVFIERKRVPQLVRLQTWRLLLPRDVAFGVPQATAWFAGLTPLLTSTSQVTIELRGEGRELCVLLSAPASMEARLRGQLAAWFPLARLLSVSESDAEITEGATLGLRLDRPHIHPLHVAEGDTTDPLRGVIAGLTSRPGRCGLRLTIGPAPADWSHWAPAALHAARKHQALPPRGNWYWVATLAGMFWQALTPRPDAKPPKDRPLPDMGAKVRQPILGAQVTIWAGGGNSSGVQAQCHEIALALQVATRHPSGNSLSIVPTGKPTPTLALSPAECASLFHLPSAEHGLVDRPLARHVPPRETLARELQSEREPVTVLGTTEIGDRTLKFGLGVSERRFHTLVVGKTGTGKSTLLSHIAKQDLDAGRGLALIDPHGDLAEHVLGLVPEHRAKDLLYFNAGDTSFPIGFNLLHTTSRHARPLVASGVVGVFKKLYGESWGPRLEYILRNAILALLETPSPSLLTLPRLLTDKPFRRRALEYVRDPLLRSFFLEEFEGYTPSFRTEAISPILNKVGQFLASPVVRHIVGQAHSSFDLRQLMDRGGIFLANLSSGRIGEDNSDLLGGLLVAGFQLAAMSRADQPENERRDFGLLVDEFQHFTSDAFATILSEARKYRLSLTLSHQFLDQVPTSIADAVFGNVGTLCAFRVGAGDTTRLARELAPSFDAQDLVHLPNHHFCLRLARATGSEPAFSARTAAPSPRLANTDHLVAASRQRWARPRAAVEIEIADAWEGRVD